ncbi:MAG: hypothetical protein IPJ30_10645 [Acidobacteria bacterium]|nr:hypothetical protein [Acidobacteriota bacterium]
MTRFICSFKVFSSGIPGVGVAPFGTGVLPTVFESGIPGVGVAPRGKFVRLAWLTGGIPGVSFPSGAIGVPENSGGTLDAVLLFGVVCVEFPGAVADVQAATKAAVRMIAM